MVARRGGATGTGGRADATARIRDAGIIAILRGDFTADAIVRCAEALTRGGVRVLEVTLDSRDAIEGIERAGRVLGGDALVGAGTVRTPEDAERALEAGARFLVSPNLDPAALERSRAAGVPHLPGVFTATEAERAFRLGCELVKLFPADALGPAYLRALRAPLHDIGFVPTGGITPESLPAYVEAGAVAFGIGSALVSDPEQEPEALTRRAEAFVAALARARGEEAGRA